MNIIETFITAIKGDEKNFTSGSINRAIVLLAIPMILEMVMESLFAVVDVYFVAQIGIDAVATVGLTESVVTLVYSIAIGLSAAATAMVARRIGENKPADAATVAVQAIFVGGFISVLIGVAGVIFAEDILRLMGGTESLIASGVGYTRWMLGGNIVIVLLFLLNGIFRGAGDASLAMWSLWIANGLNIILDPLLIFGWGPIPAFGITGAAMATNIGRGVGVAFQLFILFGGSSIIKVTTQNLRIRWDYIQRIINLAIGSTFQFLIASASWIIMIRIIARFGSEAVAGYTIAIRLIIFTVLPSWGLSNAASTLVGQNLGAKQSDRAETSVWRAAFFNMLFLLVVGIIFFAFAPSLVGFFTTEADVIAAGILTLRILSVSYICYAYGMVIGQAFNGAGDTYTPMMINFVCFWLIEIPLGYLFAVHFGWELAGVCIAIAIAETALAVICILAFRRGKWKLKEV
ncbi:MAG: MATE family efflux transporter [Saprospiraceae bacterium]